MEDIGEGVIALINQVYTQMNPTVESMAAAAIGHINIFAGIGALLYIFGNLIKQIYYNEDINFVPYMRPFLVLLLLPLSGKITEGMDEFSVVIRQAANGSNMAISDRIQKNAEKMQEAVDKKWDRIGNDEALYEQTFGNSRASDDSGFFPIGDDIKLTIGRSTDQIKLALILLIQNLLVTMMYIAEAVLLLMSMCYKLVLRMGFPIALTLTIFPGFTNNLVSWFARYLNFSLLPAVAAMYSTIAFALLNLYLDSDPVDVASGSEMQSPEFLGFAYIGILMLSLVGYLFVPSMTHMLINVGGAGAIMAGSSRAVSQAGSTASRAGMQAAHQVRSRLGNATGAAISYGGQSAGLTGAGAQGTSAASVARAAATGGATAVVGAVMGAFQTKKNKK
jgi:hypothetical protein